MTWPIAEVARMSGVTARTLRHYDQIGLLPPARIGTNGHRYYEAHQLLRLQQILVLRALGLGLSEIGRILAAQVDELDALRGHHRRLLAERDRLDALAGTVSRTITELEQSRKDGRPMTSINRPENLFEGVQPAQYTESLRDFPELAERIEQHTSTMSQAEIDAGHRERTAQMIRLAELLAAGTPADAGPVQAEIDAQYRALAELRTVRAAEYRAIGRACVDNEQWRAAYEAIAPGLAQYQRDAIEVYATTRLS
ncbi:MerR family transcriptional regulator [Streptomyces sp. NBC_00873]|uniref:MerR family transcriptional regulator n=1 Tax=unclassified Streptomyces TaxID=2593676 RepID=UPI00386AACC8|nr:MerR family transcriptional regulator [Streptomyces sp. NBC_00873]WSY96650.1 MerR family transcriptional regulator [Streptomyces sp. NBC_00873]WTA41576.1 MerR family transcriptional regulator [Streptomyces sp. NBC_00842]WTA48320.1 MerR family transcriptional regulator [Streptomyces sp. NBC_00842]